MPFQESYALSEAQGGTGRLGPGQENLGSQGNPRLRVETDRGLELSDGLWVSGLGTSCDLKGPWEKELRVSVLAGGPFHSCGPRQPADESASVSAPLSRGWGGSQALHV